MPSFIAIRHGSNAANQTMTPRMVLGTVTAETVDAARTEAESRWSFYANQRLELIDLAGRTRKADREEAADADSMATECC